MLLRNKHSQGQMLIEALVALSVFLIALTAITITVITAVSNSRFAQDQNNANKYAQDGIERVKNMGYPSIKDLNITESMGEDGTLSSTQTNIVNVGNPLRYKRDVEFVTNGVPCTNGTRVTVTVKWTSPKCSATQTYCHQSKQTTCITASGVY